ncbi:MAG: hypothetical protein ACPH5G_14890 [Pseudooceanicola atlanticus]
MGKKVKIRGERGRWVAEVEGNWLGVIHSSLRTGMNDYFQPIENVKPESIRYQELITALENNDMLVVQKDAGGSFARDGYVGVFEFEDFQVLANGDFRLRITKRYASPK